MEDVTAASASSGAGVGSGLAAAEAARVARRRAAGLFFALENMSFLGVCFTGVELAEVGKVRKATWPNMCATAVLTSVGVEK